MYPETIETESLVLNQLSEKYVDVFELYDLFTERREDATNVFEHVPQEPYTSIKDARDHLQAAEVAWNNGDAAQYAVYTSEADLVGYTGLFFEWDRRTARLGFILDMAYWGRGYAGECGSALTELAFERLDLDVVAVGHEEGNERSKRAIEKFIDAVGGQYDGVLRNWMPVGHEIADHHRYTVTRAQYRATGGEF